MDQRIKDLQLWSTRYSGLVFMMGILLAGVILRLRPILSTDFVLNDGGMFYCMVKDLQANDFLLPAITSYNFSSIPYAYPPLSFYIIAALNQFLQIDLVQIFRFYPLIFNILSIPVFFFLCREFFRGSNFIPLLATYFYAILPSSSQWLIVGGGVTRSPAQTFFLLSLAYYLRFQRKRSWLNYGLAGFFSGMMFTSHLEYCWIWVISVFAVSFQREHIRRWLYETGGLFLITGTLALPYLMTVIEHHTYAPFLNAFSSGDFQPIAALIRMLIGLFTEEYLVTFINVLALLGIFFAFREIGYRRVISWLVAVLLLDNRSAFRSITFPVAILAAITTEFLFCRVTSVGKDPSDTSKSTFLQPLSIGLLTFTITYPFLLAYLSGFTSRPVLQSLDREDRAAMTWIRDNTEGDSEWMVVDENESWINDRVGEWLPALAERKVVTTVQGTEWLPDHTYQKAVGKSKALRQCIQTGSSCPNYWDSSENSVPHYIYIRTDECQRHHLSCEQRISTLLELDQPLTQVYSNQEVELFLVSQP